MPAKPAWWACVCRACERSILPFYATYLTTSDGVRYPRGIKRCSQPVKTRRTEHVRYSSDGVRYQNVAPKHNFLILTCGGVSCAQFGPIFVETQIDPAKGGTIKGARMGRTYELVVSFPTHARIHQQFTSNFQALPRMSGRQLTCPTPHRYRKMV